MTRFIFWLLVLCSLASCSSTQPVRPDEIETIEPVVITDAEIPQWDTSVTELEDVQAQYENFLASQTPEEESYAELSEPTESQTEQTEQTEQQDTLLDKTVLNLPVSDEPLETSLDAENIQETTQTTITETVLETAIAETTEVDIPQSSETEEQTTQHLEPPTSVGDSVQSEKQPFSPPDRKVKIAILSAVGLAVVSALVRLFRSLANKKKPKAEPEMGVLERFFTEEVKIVDTEEKPKKEISLQELLLAERGSLPDENENPKNKT